MGEGDGWGMVDQSDAGRVCWYASVYRRVDYFTAENAEIAEQKGAGCSELVTRSNLIIFQSPQPSATNHILFSAFSAVNSESLLCVVVRLKSIGFHRRDRREELR